MAEITAAMVKALRDKTNLPMMKCKEALERTGGDEAAALEYLRKEGEKFIEGRSDRSTEEGRIAIHASIDEGVGAMIELQCESAPVTANEEFVLLANDLARQLATGPGAATPDELWEQPSPSRKGMTLAQQRDELANKIREVFRLARILRVDGSCGGYVHHTAKDAALLPVEGGTQELAKGISMHVVSMNPQVANKEELDAAEVAKEREILGEAARKEGKPEKIIEKMVEGRLQNFYAERVLTEQPYVMDDKEKVGDVASAAGMKIVGFHRWRLGES